MSQILAGLEGIVCHVDGTIIFSAALTEHNSQLHAVLSLLQTAGFTLDAERCKFHQDNINSWATSLTVMVYILTQKCSDGEPT